MKGLYSWTENNWFRSRMRVINSIIKLMWVHIYIHFNPFLLPSFFPPLFLPFYSSWLKSYSCTLWIQLAFIFQTNYHHFLSWNRNIESDSNEDEQRESTINWWSFDGSLNPFVEKEEKGSQLWLLSNPIWSFFLQKCIQIK